MTPDTIVVFGGTPSQLRRIESAVYPRYQVRQYALETAPSDIDFRTLPALFVILSRQFQKKAQTRISELRRSFPDRPRMLLTGNPTRQEIIRAFHMGAHDVLLFPFQEKEFLRRTERLLHEHPPGWNKWTFRLQRRLRKLLHWRRPPDTDATAVLPKHYFGIVPSASLMVKKSREQSLNYDLAVHFFGSLTIFFKNKRLRISPGRKIASILAYLLYHHHKPIHREILMGIFWGAHAPSSARNSLNVSIHHIRKLFEATSPGQDIILFQNESYVINPQLEVYSDVDQFNQHWRKGRAIENTQGLESALGAYNKAVTLYRGDLLENLPYEEWCEPERSNLKESYLLILDRLSTHFFREGAYTAAETICKKMLAKDPCLEDAHRRLMQCYAQIGLRDQAIRQYRHCVRILREELDVDPSLETQEVFLAISGISLHEAQKATKAVGRSN